MIKSLTEGAVAAIALQFLIVSANKNFGASLNALVGLIATSMAQLFAAFAAPFPESLKRFPNLSSSIVSSDPIMVFILPHIPQSTLNSFVSFRAFLLS